MLSIGGRRASAHLNTEAEYIKASLCRLRKTQNSSIRSSLWDLNTIAPIRDFKGKCGRFSQDVLSNSWYLSVVEPFLKRPKSMLGYLTFNKKNHQTIPLRQERSRTSGKNCPEPHAPQLLIALRCFFKVEKSHSKRSLKVH